MRRHAIWIVGAVVFAACTFDFDQYLPQGNGDGGESGIGGDAGASNNGGGGALGGMGGSGGLGGLGGSGGSDPCEAATDGTSCGDPGDTECDNPDSCLSGVCATNLEPDDTPCSGCQTALCAGCLMGVCASCAAANTSTTTLFASDIDQGGNMFDIVASQTVRITGFDVSMIAGATVDFEVYGRAGGYAGAEMDAAMWTPLGTALGVVSNGLDIATPLPLVVDVLIAAGETYAFYITAPGSNVRYTTGTTEGAVYVDDGNIQILEGLGNTYLFGPLFTPRVWNGTVHYETCP